jgi:Major tropism determinant N-terminal domain
MTTATQVKRRRGTTAQHATFTGAVAELTVDTTKSAVVVHDGATAGGTPQATETFVNNAIAALTAGQQSNFIAWYFCV